MTEEGFELTFATNHLGTFAFTGLMLGRMLAVPGSRVVTVSSIGHRRGRMNFADLHFERRYDYQKAYFQSKLANLLFSYELHRRLTEAGAATISVAAHPGNARTEFGRDMSPFVRIMMRPVMRPLTWWLMHDPEVGALAAVRAAVDPSVARRRVLRPSGARPVHRASRAHRVEPGVLRHRRAATAVEGVGAPDGSRVRLPGQVAVFVLKGAGRAVGAEGGQARRRRAALSAGDLPMPKAAVMSVAVVPGSRALNLMPGWALAYWTVSMVAAALDAA